MAGVYSENECHKLLTIVLLTLNVECLPLKTAINKQTIAGLVLRCENTEVCSGWR